MKFHLNRDLNEWKANEEMTKLCWVRKWGKFIFTSVKERVEGKDTERGMGGAGRELSKFVKNHVR